ncbi:MAG: cyclase family protein [Desulfobacteraceae bacterium]|nr:cyclase family protein [Desulfobacteraceae bacterium]
MIQYKNIYDISVALGRESVDYPGDTPFSRKLISTTKDNGIFNLSEIVLSAHSGTHIDTPAHFISGGQTVDSYKVQDFILPAHVVSVDNREAVEPGELENLDIEPASALLFKTDNSTSGRCKNGIFSENFVYLSPRAADLCIEKKVKLVGIDYITIEKYGDETFPIHRKILGNNILVLEGINLNKVRPGNYTLICFPLKITGSEASPVRAVLLD